MARGMTECPFACGWSTDELMSDPELAAVEGGADRLQLHLRVEHGAHTERDDQAWQDDGSWSITLYGVDLADPLRLSEDER